MRADLVLRKLIEMAGGPSERGYVLALAAEGFSNLPSTSTDGNGPLTALGAILVAFGALLLRRPGRQMR